MADPTGEYRVIDLTARKPEHEWGRAGQAAVERATAAWFTWIGWLLACGALAYLAAKTGSALVAVLAYISEVMIWFYFVTFISSIRIEPLMTRLVQSNTRTARVYMVLLGTVFASVGVFGMRALIERVIELLKVTQP
jgi:hypothetical protein